MNEEEWRAQRGETIKARTTAPKEGEESQAKMEQQLDALLTRILTPEARTRLNNIHLVNPEKYLQVSQTVVMLLQQGRIQGKVDENQLKQLLTQLTPRKEMRITRK